MMNQTIGRLIKLASNELAREMNDFARQYDLTGMQMSVIDFLSYFPGNSCDQHQLEREFDIKRSTTTVMLQRMVKRGLITRETSPSDRRQKVVSLTTMGKKLIPFVHDYIQKSETAILNGLDKEDVAKLQKMLRAITRKENVKNE